jgi:hypothetical protein
MECCSIYFASVGRDREYYDRDHKRNEDRERGIFCFFYLSSIINN